MAEDKDDDDVMSRAASGAICGRHLEAPVHGFHDQAHRCLQPELIAEAMAHAFRRLFLRGSWKVRCSPCTDVFF